MSNFHKNNELMYIKRIRKILKELPNFLSDYFRAITPRTQPTTRYNYAVDLRIFFSFVAEYQNVSVKKLSLKNFEKLESKDIEMYLEYLTSYEKGSNINSSLGRKLSSVRSFYNYYVSHREYPEITYNPTLNVAFPKERKKDIIFMNNDEIKQLLHYVSEYEKVISKNNHKLAYYKRTKYRDIAIISLLLGTGIRVSECVGLNIDDVDFKNNSIKVTRKGNKEQVLYFSNSVLSALADYLDYERYDMECLSKDVTPLFYSIQKTRLSIRSMERVVKKYASEVIPYKNITAHKLRASYATELYENSNDLYLTSEALGHSCTDVTKRYANLSEKRRKEAPNYIDY